MFSMFYGLYGPPEKMFISKEQASSLNLSEDINEMTSKKHLILMSTSYLKISVIIL